MTTIDRCHDTHHQVRCSLPAGHSSDCRFPSTPTGEIEIAIDVMHGASRVYWATPGVQNVLDTATLALQAALDEIASTRKERDALTAELAAVENERDYAIRQVGEYGGGEL